MAWLARVVAIFSLLAGFFSVASAEVKSTTVLQYELKDGKMQMTSGQRTVTTFSPERTEAIVYALDETGEKPLSRTVTLNAQNDKERVTVVSVEQYRNKEFVLTGRTTTVSRAGITETLVEALVEDRIVPVQRIIQTASTSPGVVDMMTMREERIDGSLRPTREERVVRIDYQQLASSRLPDGLQLDQVPLARRGVQTVTLIKTLVDGSLKLISARSQVDE